MLKFSAEQARPLETIEINILSDSGENLCVNWETVEDWELVQESPPPRVEEVNMTFGDKKREISTAKQK